MPGSPVPVEDDDGRTWSRAVRRHVHAPAHEWFAACAPGLEPMLADEMRQAGLVPAPAVPGGVAFRGRLVDGYAANLHLRLANRVLVRVAAFAARAPEDVVREVRAVPWDAWLPADVPLRVDVAIHESRMASTGLVATKALDAIRDRMHASGATMPSVAETGSPHEDADGAAAPRPSVQRLMLRLERNRLTVSLDSSGEHLHRRGYRVAVTPAPIRETLAAAVLRFAGHRGDVPLVDPMCGSGTFPIEAAGISANLPAGRLRSFAFQRWPSFRPATWGWLLRKADAARRVPGAALVGADRDATALDAARANAARAGTGDVPVFLHRDFAELSPNDLPGPAGEPGLLVANPPYGLRLEPGADPATLYRRIGHRLAAAWRGWRFAIVLPDERLARVLELPVDAILRLPHGGLTVVVARGRVP